MQDMHQHYNYLWVALSYVVAVLGSYTALQFALGIRLARTPRRRWIAVAGAGAAMGGGAIWAMHFIAMLACSIGAQATYDVMLTGISALLAIVVCSLALAMVGDGAFRWSHGLGAGTLMGLGIAGTHYLGMSAMLMSARVSYDIRIVALSVVTAVLASTVALWLAFNLRGRLQVLGSALVLGAAVCGMHYIGMGAATFTERGTLPAGFDQGVGGDHLGRVIFAIVVALLVLALGLSIVRQYRRAVLSI
ncbi:MHYT domain-containing protein [Dyella sp. RRB7]|uniref:MHYT domain-containing protein n=1 Tax=Dyella sp. RRB7 TaxID=2919502 RepID=UPI001FAAE8CD|nr:MHYT domain-containing protein [Dyella sp. RRB7]